MTAVMVGNEQDHAVPGSIVTGDTVIFDSYFLYCDQDLKKE
jgi:hypothetical protein